LHRLFGLYFGDGEKKIGPPPAGACGTNGDETCTHFLWRRSAMIVVLYVEKPLYYGRVLYA
ncbi:MAG: hypothetical protein CFH37_00332, partial [Alphaproteobacteria bacterium MarineAlpha9_Bin7]